MFRTETIVCLVIALIFVSRSHAEDKKDKNDNAAIHFSEKWEKERCDEEEKSKTPKCQEWKKLMGNAVGANAQDECSSGKIDELKEKVELAEKQFKTACGGAGLPIDESAGVACSIAIEKCQGKVSGGGTPDEEGHDHARSSELARSCPGMVGKEKKDLKERLDQAKKDKRESEEKAAKAQEKGMEQKNKALDEQGKAEETRAKAEQKLDDDLAEAEKKYLDAKKQIAAEIVQLQRQIADADDQIRQLTLQKTDADMEHTEAIRQIEWNCYKQASETVTAYQKDRLSRPFNRGGFGAMLKQVGLSDRASWQRLANRYYRFCLASQPTHSSKASAKAKYEAALRRANVQIQKAEAQKQSLIAEQMKKKNGVCNTSTPTSVDPSAPDETDSCQAAKTAMADADRATRKANSEADKAAKEEARAAQKAYNADSASAMEAGREGQKAADDAKRAAGLQRAYQIAAGADSQTNGDPKAHDKALEKFDELTTAARRWRTCANKNGGCVGDCARYLPILKGAGKVADAEDRPEPGPVSADKKITSKRPRAPADYDRTEEVMKSFGIRDSTGDH